MGYDLHITRRQDWSDEGNDITAEEWLKLVAADAELTLNTVNGPYCVQWSGASKLSEPWLDWSDGQIYAKNPDRALVAKMLALARALSARVVGDDGEEYTRAEDFPENTAADPGAVPARAANHTRTVIVLVLILLASILVAIVGRNPKERTMGVASAVLWLFCLVWVIKKPR